MQVEQLLIDEKKARQIAESRGLKFTGVIGILVEAKKRGLIAEIRPSLDMLRNPVNFWISESLYQRVLKMVEE